MSYFHFYLFIMELLLLLFVRDNRMLYVGMSHKVPILSLYTVGVVVIGYYIGIFLWFVPRLAYRSFKTCLFLSLKELKTTCVFRR